MGSPTRRSGRRTGGLPPMTESPPSADRTTAEQERWLTPGVRGIGTASFLADVGQEIPHDRPADRQRAASVPGVLFGRRGTNATASAGTMARTSQGTAAGRPRSSREPVAALPMRTIRPLTEDRAPV